MSPPFTQERPKPGHGGGGVHPPGYGGGGDPGPGDGFSDYEHRLHRARLGLILGIVSITMLFVVATTFFFFLNAPHVIASPGRPHNHGGLALELPVRLLLLNTCVLLLSSLTVHFARRSVAREMIFSSLRNISGVAWDVERGVPWLAITIILGIVFLGGQCLAWAALATHAAGHASRTGFGLAFYFLTGAHAVHLTAGIVVLLYAGVISLQHRSLEHRRIVLETVAWYWHFMGLLWIYVFALLQFGG